MTKMTTRIEEQLEAAGIHAAVEDDGSTITLSGEVGSDEERRAALDMVSDVAGDRRVEDGLEVRATFPGEVGELEIADAEIGSLPGSEEGLDEQVLEAGDFTQGHTTRDPLGAAGPTSALDEPADISEGDTVYVPPIDPVGTNDEVIGGFQESSMQSVEVERSALDGRYGDEAIAHAVRRELREDSATTDLAVRVTVEGGVVRLLGLVPFVEDSDNAAEVASRVPGVVEVREELEVEALR